MRRLLLVVLVLVLPSCGGDGDDHGTPIADGFETVEDTELLGRAFPEEQGWRAELWMDGDPQEVVEAFMAQAEDRGFDVAPLPDEQGTGRCAGRGPDWYECDAVARDGDRVLRIIAVRSPLAGGVTLRYSDDPAYSGGAAAAHGDTDATVPPAVERPPLAAVGEEIGGIGEQIAHVRVEEGSALVGPPIDNEGCATYGEHAVLSITGDPDDVAAGYAAQLQDLVPQEEPVEVGTLDVDGGRQLVASASQAGGYGWVIQIVVPDDEEADVFGLITTCND